MDITKLNQRPMGMGRGAGTSIDLLAVGVTEPKLWVQLALAAASLASSIYGGVKASEASKDSEARQRRQEAKEDAWYRRRYNEDYIDTAAGQNLVRRAKEYAKENWKRAAGAQAVAGGTDAATAQAKEAGNKMVGDTIANIAATDQQRKSQVDDLHRQADAQFAQMDMQRDLQRAQNITQAAQGASNALASAAGTIGQGNTSPNLVGSSNKGSTVDVSGSLASMRDASAKDVQERRAALGLD